MLSFKAFLAKKDTFFKIPDTFSFSRYIPSKLIDEKIRLEARKVGTFSIDLNLAILVSNECLGISEGSLI